MHIIRPPFRMNDDEAVAFAAKRGFGVVIAADSDGPRGSHVPFTIHRAEGRLVAQFHLTAKNPLIGLADGRTRFLLVVSGADAYVSNDWYESPDQVSTWLYEAVHLSGIGRLRPTSENRPHGDELLAVSEARLPKQPWSMATMEPDKRESMLAMIRVIDIEVDRIEGQSKLNHHKIDVDHVAVARHLARSEDSAARHLAARMRALRPDLDYGTD
ncbi:MAG: FMN-binding negative transcriptional regulator [Burkholderiaceae bacterium]